MDSFTFWVKNTVSGKMQSALLFSSAIAAAMASSHLAFLACPDF
jgi:hypothetical protein